MGAVYKVKVPFVNAALPPLAWQTYDIYYTAGTGTNGTFTTYLNGVLVQDATPVSVVTEAGFNGTTLYLQNHRNEVIYNNIWMIPNATPASLPYRFMFTTADCFGSCPPPPPPPPLDRIMPGSIGMTRTTDADQVFDAMGRSLRARGGTLPSGFLLDAGNGH
jgi:hypothetical protein